MAQSQVIKKQLVQTEKIVRKTLFSITAGMRVEQARDGLRLVTQKEIDELEARAKARFEARGKARRALGIEWFAQFEPANEAKIEAFLAKSKPRASKGGAR